MPVVLCGCETWSHTLREQHRLRVSENRVLRKIFGLRTDEVTGHRRKLHSVELHNLYSTSNIIRQIKSRRMRWAELVARMGGERKVFRFWWESRKERRPLERPRLRWRMVLERILGRLAGGRG
jgi:Asp-tRNA(Asn)/Glu-tRNA(Gln) amidotransferase B subunit